MKIVSADQTLYTKVAISWCSPENSTHPN